MENIQRLLGGGGDREGGDREGGGEEDREEVVANIEEGEMDNRIESAENVPPKKSMARMSTTKSPRQKC